MSAKCLDRLRLGKQRLECKQLLTALDGLSKGWVNHPACKMWRGYSEALKAYSDVVITEWVSRGYRNTMKIHGITDYEKPWWLGDEKFHAAHRSNLLRKDKVWYGQFGWEEKDDLPYVWPV